jgi:hypothetical protein
MEASFWLQVAREQMLECSLLWESIITLICLYVRVIGGGLLNHERLFFMNDMSGASTHMLMHAAMRFDIGCRE